MDTVNPLPYNTALKRFNRSRFEYLQGYYFEEARDSLYYKFVKDKSATYSRMIEDNSLYQRLHVYTMKGRSISTNTEDLFGYMANSVDTATSDKLFRGCFVPTTMNTTLAPITIKNVKPYKLMDVYKLTDSNGIRVMVTLETQILTYNGFVKVKNLTYGNMLYNMAKVGEKAQFSYVDTITLFKKQKQSYGVYLNEVDHHIVANGLVLY